MTDSATYLVPRLGDGLPGLVAGALAEAGYSLFPADDVDAARTPGVVRVDWHRRARTRPDGPDRLDGLDDVGVIEVTGRRDLSLAVALSRRTGGFVVASAPARRSESAIVLYSGHLLAGASGRLELISRWSLDTLELAGITASGEVVATPSATADPDRVPSPGHLNQIALACDERDLRRAVAAADWPVQGGWRWLAGVTPEADVPYVLLRGDHSPDPAWLADLAARTGSFAAAAELAGPGEPAQWGWATPGGELTSGVAATGDEVIDVWRDLASVLGTYAATFAWPAAEPGESLDAPP